LALEKDKEDLDEHVNPLVLKRMTEMHLSVLFERAFVNSHVDERRTEHHLFLNVIENV
jgi:hypothetical protein